MKLWTTLDGMLGRALEGGSRMILALFAAQVLIVCVFFQSRALFYPYSLDYGEAPLIDQALRLVAGQSIYRADLSAPPYTISNYPPVYVGLLSPGVAWFGPAATFTYGRLLSVLASWTSALCLVYIVRTLTRNTIAGWLTGVVFLAFPYVVIWSSLVRIDLVALAFSLAGLSLVIRQPVSRPRLMAAALLLVAAIFTRQSYALAAPLAAFSWLATKNRRQAIGIATCVAGLSLALYLVLNALTDGGFYLHTVTSNINQFSTERVVYHGKRLWQAATIPVLVAGASLFLLPRWNPAWPLVVPYLVGATISAATIGKIGSNINYLLELCAALSVAAGVTVATIQSQYKSKTLTAILTCSLALSLAPLMQVTVHDFGGYLEARRALTSEINRLTEIVAAEPGLVLADEYMSLLTRQGRSLEFQPFEITQLARAGIWDQGPLLKRIADRQFSLILLLDSPSSIDDRWTQEMVKAIQQSYDLVDTIAGNRVYRPNSG